MRLVFLGNDPWSVPSLEALLTDPTAEVVSVITNPPRPAGRGSSLTPTAVAAAALASGAALLEVDGVGSGPGEDAIRAAAPDALVVVAYGELLSPAVLAIPALGAINVHFSLLPRWRGAAPIQHALLAGDTATGVTVMRMDEGLDTGPVLAAERVEIGAAEDAGSLGARLAVAGAVLLRRTLPDYASGEIRPTDQPSEGVTLAPKLTPADRDIHWSEEASRTCGRVRAMSPGPGARTQHGGVGLKVLLAEEAAGAGADAAPGTVVAMDERGPVVAAGSGFVRLLQLAPDGRKHMSAAEWARGARILPGERLG